MSASISEFPQLLLGISALLRAVTKFPLFLESLYLYNACVHFHEYFVSVSVMPVVFKGISS